MLPFTVSKSSVPVQSARPNFASIDPFTVSAFTSPPDETSTLPFTVSASTSPSTSVTRTAPLTVCAPSFTPAGTLTENSTWTSLLLVLLWPPPGSQVLRREPLLG